MQDKKIGKILLIVVLVSIVFMSLYNVYAAINVDYYNATKDSAKVVETSSTLNKKTKSSVILDAVGSFIYVVANFVEYLIKKLFTAVSGDDIFPWADMIVFNAIPLLDVNFLNPNSNSFVSNLQGVISSTYGTVFGLALAFFSIAVLVMGIKIAISTIASEKAKYKQAIGDWFLALVLLFTIHFGMSFAFYLNEQLVKEASDIASKNIQTYGQVIQEVKATSVSDQELVGRFMMSQLNPTWLDDTIRGAVAGTVGGLIAVGLTAASGGAGAPAALAIGVLSADTVLQWFNSISSDTQAAMSNLQTEENVKIAAQLLKDEAYTKKEWNCVSDTSDYWTWGTSQESRIRDLSDSVNEIRTADDTKYESWKTSKSSSTESGDIAYYQALMDAYDITVMGEAKGTSQYSLITNLAQYFKEAAWTYGSNSWKTSKVVIQNAIMYAILVVQSLIFLVSYTKRVFYIIMLALMAPIVVVYDFFNKSLA